MITNLCLQELCMRVSHACVFRFLHACFHLCWWGVSFFPSGSLAFSLSGLGRD